MDIYLNIYDLHESNQYLHAVGSGFYHTGVEIQGYEYSFSNHGVSRTRPQLVEFGNLREHLLMGTFPGTMVEVNRFISTLSEGEFRPGVYNVSTKNCNHFSDALMMLLLNIHIPTWVNRMANLANSLPTRNDTSNKTETGFAAPGKVRDPTLPVKVEQSSTGKLTPDSNNGANSSSSFISSIFSWFGGESTQSFKDSGTVKTSAIAGTSTPIPAPAAPPSNKKKELTEEQKRLIEKMKQGKA